MRVKDRCKYHGISLPKPLIDEVIKIINRDGMYHGIAEFIREAIREKILRGRGEL
jgi:metal-responsive CopG/Arc/MetJ family transcriptional regulator